MVLLTSAVIPKYAALFLLVISYNKKVPIAKKANSKIILYGNLIRCLEAGAAKRPHKIITINGNRIASAYFETELLPWESPQ